MRNKPILKMFTIFFSSIFIMLTRWGSPSPPRELARAQKKTRANLNSNQKNERFGKFHVCQSQVDGDGFYEWESSRGFIKRGQNVVILEAEQWRIWLNHRIIRKHMEMREIRVDGVKLLHIQLDTRCVDSDEDVLTLIIGLWVITNFTRTGWSQRQHSFSDDWSSPKETAYFSHASSNLILFSLFVAAVDCMSLSMMNERAHGEKH